MAHGSTNLVRNMWRRPADCSDSRTLGLEILIRLCTKGYESSGKWSSLAPVAEVLRQGFEAVPNEVGEPYTRFEGGDWGRRQSRAWPQSVSVRAAAAPKSGVRDRCRKGSPHALKLLAERARRGLGAIA